MKSLNMMNFVIRYWDRNGNMYHGKLDGEFEFGHGDRQSNIRTNSFEPGLFA